MTAERMNLEYVPEEQIKESRNIALWKNIDDEEKAEELLKQKVDPNYAVRDGLWRGWTLLAYAVYKEKLSLVTLLLKYGARPDQPWPGSLLYPLKQPLICHSFNQTYGFSTSRYELDQWNETQATGDFRIPYALIKHGATIPIGNWSGLNTPKPFKEGGIDLYKIIRYVRFNSFSREDDGIIKALASKPEFALALLAAHFTHLYNKNSIFSHQHHWTWEEAYQFSKLIPCIPEELNMKLQRLTAIALEKKHWEVAFVLILKNRKSALEMEDKKDLPLVTILKNTTPHDFLTKSSPEHQNPTNCLESILANGANSNEVFEHQGKIWSALSWCVKNYNFVAAKLLIKYGAKPDQIMPGTTLKLTDFFPIDRLQEFKQEECLLFTMNSPKEIAALTDCIPLIRDNFPQEYKRPYKEIEIKNAKLGIDVRTALILRIQESIDVIHDERLALQSDFENSPENLKRQRLDFDEELYKLQKIFLDKFDDKAANDDFSTLNEFYPEFLENKKLEFFQIASDRKKALLSVNRFLSLDIKEKMFNEFEKQIKAVINECAIKFLNFSVKEQKCLRERFKKWSDNIYNLRQQQKMLDEELRELSLDKEQKDSPLRLRIKNLNELKQNLLNNKDMKNDKVLYDYLLQEPNRRDRNGFYPLHYACILRDPRLAKKLIEKNANTEIHNLRCIRSEWDYSITDFLRMLRPDNFRLFLALEHHLQLTISDDVSMKDMHEHKK